MGMYAHICITSVISLDLKKIMSVECVVEVQDAAAIPIDESESEEENEERALVTEEE